jgi:DNA invertase Pin-like site-specific DNA recombinase
MAITKRSSTIPSKQVQRAAIYCRCSTFDQNPEMQLDELRDFARRRGFHVSAEYVDQGVSGARERRPQLDLLMRDSQRRKFDVLLVWKLDRFARSLKHLVNALAEFEALGVAFVSLRDNLDLTTPAGRLMFQVIGAMSEFERALITERVRAGIANAQKRGVRFGRPKVYVSRDRVTALRSEGLSWRMIAKKMKLGVGTIYRAAHRGQRGIQE